MRIPSGVTDQVMVFVAVDSTDLKTRETGLTTFTVYRSRNGGTATVMTTPTVAELDATNMPGVYTLLMDEDMTLTAGNDSEEMAYHITQAAMADVTRTIEIYRRSVTSGNTLDVTATGAAGIDWGNVENPTTAVDLSGTDIQLADTVTTLTNLPSIPANWLTAAGIAASALDGKGDWNIGKTGYSLTQSFPTNFADMAITVTTGKVTIGTNDDKAGYSISGTKQTLDALNDITTANVNTEVLDVMNVDTFGEPAQGAPGATISIFAKINYIYKVLRNKKTATATLISIYDDAGTTVDHKRTISDDATTYTEEEIVTGP